MATVNRARRGIGAVAALAVIGIAACSADSDRSSQGTSFTDQPAAAQETGDGSLSGGEATADPTRDPVTGQLTGQLLSSRKLVITMTIGLEVKDASKAVDQVITLAQTHLGQLYDSSLDLTDPAYASGDLVFKLPPEEVTAFLRGLDPGIGRRTGLDADTADVTDQLSDLESQIATARASVERVRALMERTTTLSEIVTLEGELTARETRLEQLLAQQSNLENLVEMATITIHLTTAPVDDAPAPQPEEKTTIRSAFSDGWNAFVAVVRAIVLFFGYTLPFLVLAAIGALIAWRFRRPSRNRSAAPLHPPAQAAGPSTNPPGSEAPARIP